MNERRPLHSEGKAMRSRWEGGKQGNRGEQIGGREEGEITVRTWREEKKRYMRRQCRNGGMGRGRMKHIKIKFEFG